MTMHKSSAGSKARRNLKPRDPVIVAPVLVSQLTCLSLLGIDPGRYLALVARLGLPHRRVGKLVLVDARDARRLVSSTAVAANDGTSAESEGSDEQIESADDIARAFGLARAR